MRELKFRVWNITEKVMSEVDLFWFEEEGVRNVPGDAYGYQVMQFTGLKDKNGKDVYEGDIVLHGAYEDNWVVTWCEGKGENLGNQIGWWLTRGHYMSEFEAYCNLTEQFGRETEEYLNAVVVGNIYEHPELALKEED